MPIRPENKDRYPADWPEIRARILERAGHRCEFCEVENYALVERDSGKITKIVLTIAHMDHTPEHCEDENLRALCQRCHLEYDAQHHAEQRRLNAKKVKAVGDLFDEGAAS